VNPGGLSLALAILIGATGVAGAQQAVVQQPEFRQFTVPGTVLVPDQGSVTLGGVGSAAAGRSVPGPLPLGSARAGGTGAANVQVRVWVHDLQSMDEALLRETAPPEAPAVKPIRIVGAAPARPNPLTTLRTAVERALRAEAAASDFAERSAAVRRLVELHDELQAAAGSAAAGSVRGLQNRVAARLVRVAKELGRTVDGTSNGGSAASSAASAAARAPARGGAPTEARALIDLIQGTVRPEAWDTGGGPGTIRYFANGHALVVLAPEDVHEELGGVLRQLR